MKETRHLITILSPVEQYLTQTQKRLFKGFNEYEDVHRLMFDIETTSLRPQDGMIFLLGVLDNRGNSKIFYAHDDGGACLMRFLVDECTGPNVASWLRENDYEVFSVFENARGMEDDDIIQKAVEENWILITNDKDFGDKVYRDGHLHRGIILLRLEDERSASKINVLSRLFENHIDRLPDSFVVVTEKQVRFARR